MCLSTSDCSDESSFSQACDAFVPMEAVKQADIRLTGSGWNIDFKLGVLAKAFYASVYKHDFTHAKACEFIQKTIDVSACFLFCCFVRWSRKSNNLCF